MNVPLGEEVVLHKLIRPLLLGLILLTSFTLINSQFTSMQPVYASPDPDTFNSSPTSYVETGTIDYKSGSATDTYDKDNATYAEFKYSTIGSLQLINFEQHPDFKVRTYKKIENVSFKMKYEVPDAGKKGKYRIVYYVSPSVTATTLVDWTDVAHSVPVAGADVWTNQTEPNDNVWSWTDVSNIKFVVEVNDFGEGGGAGYFWEYEAWVTVVIAPTKLKTESSPLSSLGGANTAGGFHVNITVEGAIDLYLFSCRLGWNNTSPAGKLFEISVKIDEGPFLKTGGSTFFTKKIYNNNTYLSNTLLGVAAGVNGDGTLVTVYFTSSKALGTGVLDLYETSMLDSFGNAISHVAVDGSFDNTGLSLISPATVAIEGSSTVSTVRGFEVNVTIASATAVYSWMFKLVWNVSLFEAVDAVEGPFLKSGGATTFTLVSIDNSIGVLHIKCKLNVAAAGVSGSGNLTTIYFTSSKNTGTNTIMFKKLGFTTYLYEIGLADKGGDYWYHTDTGLTFDNTGLTLIPPASVFVDPTSVVTANSFTVDINISSATDIYSYEFRLSWNWTLVSVTGVTEGAFLSSGGTTDLNYAINNAWGYMDVDNTLVSGTPVSGSGTLITISFSPYIEAGISTLNLYSTKPGGVNIGMLRDDKGQYWYHTITDGSLDNRPTIYVDPPSVTTDTAFTVNIKMDSIGARILRSVTFTLRWNVSLVDCTTVTEGSLLSGVGTTQFSYVKNNTADAGGYGHVYVNVTLVSPTAYVNGSGTVASISFGAAKTSGTTVLDLYNTTLFEPRCIMLPDGNGAYVAWTNDYLYWDDPITSPDGDTTYVSAAANNLEESSTLADPSPIHGWTIGKVRMVTVARQTTGDEKVTPFLVIGGTRYYGFSFTPTATYASYAYEWSYNPKTYYPWDWGNITALEAGVKSEQTGGSWDGEIRITQMYVEVVLSPDISTINVMHKVSDGFYNSVPPVPEFPLGAVMEIALAITIAYVWLRRKRKTPRRIQQIQKVPM